MWVVVLMRKNSQSAASRIIIAFIMGGTAQAANMELTSKDRKKTKQKGFEMATKQKIKLTVSQLNDFNYYLNQFEIGDKVMINIVDIYERIKAKPVRTFPMMFGSAFGYFLTCSDEILWRCTFHGHCVNIYEDDQIAIRRNLIDEARKHIDNRGAIAEAFAEKTYNTEYYDVIVRGKADNVGLNYIDEHKTTGHYMFPVYEAALQGDLYTELFNVDRANYIVFELNSYYNELKDVHKFGYTRDEETANRVENVINIYANFIKTHDFRDYFKVSRMLQF